MNTLNQRGARNTGELIKKELGETEAI